MKKQYIKPELEVVQIAINSLICVSLTMSGGTGSNDDAIGREDYGDDW